MASTYSPSLRIELIGTGDQSGLWGDTTNNNLGGLIEQAITGYQSITMTDTDYTLTALNGSVDQARNAILRFTSAGSLSTTRNIIIPSTEKTYIIKNDTSGGQSITVKTNSGVGVTVINGGTTHVYCDGTDVFQASQYFPNLSVGTISIGSGATGTGSFVLQNNPTLNTPTISNQNSTGGTLASVTLNSATISGGSISGITDLAITDGGTGASNSATARTNLDVPSRSGSGASGTWGIDISGNAATATTATTATSATSATTATSIAGGGLNRIPYQTGSSTTSYITTPSANTYLYFNGTNFVWQGSTGGTAQAVTFNNTGNGGTSGSSFNGSTALTVSYNTVGAPSTTGANASGTWNIAAANLWASGSNPVSIYTSSAERVRVTTGGYVGINTTNPQKQLHVVGVSGPVPSIPTIGVRDVVLIENNDNCNMMLIASASATTSAYKYTRSGYTGTGPVAALAFNHTTNVFSYQYDGAESLRIDSSGNLLVGTTASNGRVVAEIGAANTSAFYASFSGQNGNGIGLRTEYNSASGVAYHGYFRYNESPVGSITSTSTTTTYATSSDYRLKEDVKPMQNALDTVAKLNPVTYKWKSDGSSGQGFIAHELQEVVPQCVAGEKDAVDAEGNPMYQGVDASHLVATLTKAIQELKAEVDALKAAKA